MRQAVGYRRETMRSLHVGEHALAVGVTAFGVWLATAPFACADPTGADPMPVDPPPGTPPAAVADSQAEAAPAPLAAPPSGDATTDACTLFNKAVNYASINYEDFADFSAGDGNYVDYGDPTVQNANVAGRTALRQAAAAALSASGVPGLPGDIAAPMQSWSLNAAKLVLIMGVRGGGDSLNSTASKLNTDARNAQMACAAAGMHA